MKNTVLKLKSFQKSIDKSLDRYLAPEPGHPALIYRAMRYSVFAGGKRLRPALLLLSAGVFGMTRQKAMPFACALEMIHTYSLIHDDLPAMDNDDMRRGRPTCHKKFGEAAAILAGDGLLTKAFEIMMLPALKQAISPERAAAAAYMIARAAGAAGMVGGQTADMENEGGKITKGALEYIHRHKTGALISASVMSGTIIAGAGSTEKKYMKKYSENIGLAFQITDDILDITADEKKLGKTKGKDAAAGKMTYPALYGPEISRKKAEELIITAKKNLDKIKKDTKSLEDLADYITARTY
ncbi:MAG TPA: polyprenyl synthetase family protein [Firmicutes bacterium]|nr:polyprenyl synthetase family protein [Bacillota bacterium]